MPIALAKGQVVALEAEPGDTGLHRAGEIGDRLGRANVRDSSRQLAHYAILPLRHWPANWQRSTKSPNILRYPGAPANCRSRQERRLRAILIEAFPVSAGLNSFAAPSYFRVPMLQKPFKDQSLGIDDPHDGGGSPPDDPRRRTVNALSAGVLSAPGVPPIYPLIGEAAAALFPNSSLLILSRAAVGSGTVRILHAPDPSQIGIDIAVSPQMAADLEEIREAGPLSAGHWAGLFGAAGAGAGAGAADPYGIPVRLHDERLILIVGPAAAGRAEAGRGLDAAASLAALAGLARIKERLRRTTEERDELQGRVRHLLARQKDLDFKANHDDLTGLPNRKYIRTLAEDRLGRRSGDSLYALAFIDLDNFKQVNDLHGHAVGDQLLRTVASRIRCEIRSSDICGRVGGDEFVVCIDDVEQPAHCEIIFARIRNALSRPFEIEGHAINCPATLGVAYFPQDGAGYDELLRSADAAMYRAKRIGKAAR